MLTAAELQSLLRAHRLRLTKRLGQHHLVDARVVERIVEACQLTPTDTVLEIGPGLGALTEGLAERAGRVVAVEVDRGIATLLRARLAGRHNVTVACEDVLRYSWAGVRDAVAVGAIPYHITAPIIVALYEHRRAIRRAVLILQREVGGRLAAKPGTKAYGRLSVLGQYAWDIVTLFGVPRSAFYPQPEVDSVCVRLTARKEARVVVDDEATLFDVVKAAFAQRRKTLANCLSGPQGLGLSRSEAEAVLQRAGLPAGVRGETLSLSQFAAVADRFAPMRRLR